MCRFKVWQGDQRLGQGSGGEDDRPKMIREIVEAVRVAHTRKSLLGL